MFPDVFGLPIPLQRLDVLHQRLSEGSPSEKDLGNDLSARRREGRIGHSDAESKQDITKRRPDLLEPLADRAQGAHCLLPRALALGKRLEVAAEAPDPVHTVDRAALHFHRENAVFGKDDYVGLAPDLALVASKPERVEHYPRIRQFAAEAFVDLALAVWAVLRYVGYQDGQSMPPVASPK